MNAQDVLRKYQTQLDPEGIEVGVSRQALDETLERIAEIEQENERLRAECGLRQIHGYREGMERAAEIAEPYNECGSWGKIIARAIRAEITDTEK